MRKGITNYLIFTGLNLIFMCEEVRNHSKCAPITIKNGFFNATARRYECNKDYYYYMFGNNRLECQEDGNWKGEIPYCARTISVQLWKGDYEIILKNRCENSNGDKPWEIEVFGKPFSAIRIIFKENFDNIGCPDVNLSINKKTYDESYKICEFDNKFFAYEFKNIMKINIKFTIKKDSSYFDLCGICVYSKSEEKCPIASINLPNGYISPSNVNSLNYGEHLSFNCDEGFQLNGYRYLYCGVTDISNEIPQCQRIQCKNSPRKILNGIWENWNGTKSYFYQDELRLVCNPGYKLNATGSIKCFKNGEWSHTHTFRYLIACIEIRCKNSPISTINGIWKNWNQSKNYSYEDELHLNCDYGYKLNATGTIKCLENGEWSLTSATCLKKKSSINLVITVVIVAAVTLVVLVVIYFIMLKKRKRRDQDDERIIKRTACEIPVDETTEVVSLELANNEVKYENLDQYINERREIIIFMKKCSVYEEI
ncbi:complement component receptor 1-like protein [Centruroides vittatus]|uniref:complement component receptor 1-like protein n=1 Tax=Centruroides vittatus TaxID=120091 RepID=UPI0035103606